MATAPLTQGIPGTAFLDAGTQDISLPWRAFLTTLFRRTGGTVGSEAATKAALDAEEAARQAADLLLTQALAAERTARQDADGTEQAARISADAAEAQARQNADMSLTRQIIAETSARIAADALLVPIAQLCSMWAQCNLAFLPTSDPGHGQPWLDGGRVTVGSPPSGIGLEDGSGAFDLEGSTDNWIWG